MEHQKQLDALRLQIDVIDEQMIPLIEARMDISKEVADIKRKNNMSIMNETREQHVVDRAVASAKEEYRGEISLLMRAVLALSRRKQRSCLLRNELPLLPPARAPIRENLACAYQGVPGAWSEQAAAELFPGAQLCSETYFEDVFVAVKDKRAHYGVVPIENSHTGAIGETYDLLRKYGCYIVGSRWIDVHHCLLAPEGISLNDIREVYSHPEGLRQCHRFLHKHAWDFVTCRNTAVAAQMAAQSDNTRTAAIGSRRAAQLNGLQVVAPDIMDSDTNRTLFVVIASEPEYDKASDLIYVTFSTAHRSGALCEALLPFMAHGVNLMRIESRPASTANKYRFFATIKGNILDDGIELAIRQTAAMCDYFEVIGCYKEL